MFDWEHFLSVHGIDYKANPRRHIIELRCPFCFDDPSMHMGISMRGKGWHCWRNETEHSGKSTARLIAALLGCSFEEAARIAGTGDVSIPTTDATFADDMMKRLGVSTEKPRHAANCILEPLPEFRPIQDDGFCRRLVFPYLRKRWYSQRDALWLAKRYGLMYASKGRFGYRIIAPVNQNGRLVKWTGRSVASSVELRYKSLSSDPERAAAQDLPVAPMNIKECLFDFDKLRKGGRTLVVCEGPFDAMRVTFLGGYAGIMGTALFNKTPAPAQVELLRELTPEFDETVCLFDDDADSDLLLTMPDYLRIRAKRLRPKIHDPAELDDRGFAQVFNLW